MKYCGNCSFAGVFERCPFCGNKALREVTDDDFCLIAEAKAFDCDRLTEILKADGIPFSVMPCGSGVESKFALPLSNGRIYVPFAYLSKARAALAEADREQTEEIRKLLLAGADKLNIPQKEECRIRRKLKIPDQTDFLEFCTDIIKNASKISDEGRITDFNKGRYLICRRENFTLAVASATYEILFLIGSKD